MRSIRDLYEKAYFKVDIGGWTSNEIKVSQGVLQGDKLSPLLFALFISDITEYFERNGAKGLSISSDREINLLLYADDLVILAWSWSDAQKKLNILEKYCSENLLEVNISKTMVVPFHRGVTFASSAKFRKAADTLHCRGMMAIPQVRKLIYMGKPETWESRCRLFDALVRSIVLYCCEIWALNYVEKIERVQLYFFKSLFLLSRSTPDYYVRLEMGRNHIQVQVFKQALSWWLHILEMEENRLPNICYKRLCEFSYNNNIPFNWVDSLKNFLYTIGAMDIWDSQNSNLIKSEMNNLVIKMNNHIDSRDIEKVINSQYNPLYRVICNYNLKNPILQIKCNLTFLQFVIQLRLAGEKYIRFYIKDKKYVFNSADVCPLCMRETDNLIHFYLCCRLYADLRTKYINKHIGDHLQFPPEVKWEKLLMVESFQKIKDLFIYTKDCLKLRNDYLNQQSIV
ncbi:uncharacterized protein [Rhodnius prolixus]|uniref:uncharacterized protein n=1 Tax=Rhodnius prolixus TaxID=13249 RepID=UPI003D18D259